MKIFAPVFLLLAIFLLILPAVNAQSGGDYNIVRSSTDGGGIIDTSGGDYTLGGTVGQWDTGISSGGGYILQAGFWFAPQSNTPTAVEMHHSSPATVPHKLLAILVMMAGLVTLSLKRNAA